MKDFFLDEKSLFPFLVIILMTVLLLYNNSMIVNSQKNAYESDKIANELRNSSEDLTKYVRIFVATADPKYERSYWHVLNVRNGKEARVDGRKIPLNVLMKQLGFTENELGKLKVAQYNSDKLVNKEVIAMDAINGVKDANIPKLIHPGESKRDFAIRIMNDEAYHKDKTTIMNPIYEVIEMVDKRTQIKLFFYDILNYIYMSIEFLVVFLLFARFIYLINKVRQNVKDEQLIRKIFEAMRSSLELNLMKNAIVEEVGKALNADCCCFWYHDKTSEDFVIDEYSQRKSSNDIKNAAGISSKNEKFKALINLYLINKEVIFSDVKQFIKENELEGTSIEQYFKEYDIKSSYSIPVFHSDKIAGILSVNYTNDYKKLSPEDIDFLRIVAIQAGEATYQAELYQQVQFQAEREKISKTIVEILRSSIDKVIIKKLFVKNIGKFFNADRVFFSNYDVQEKVYLPVDKDSEYLSNNKPKSIIGFDFSKSEVKEHLQPLLDGREIKITDLSHYIKEHTSLKKGLKLRYEDFEVKSSYNFPVVHQNEIMGYFCIEFTSEINELSEEDINRIRSICTQAAVALYHAELYAQAQQCTLQSESHITEQIKRPTSDILNASMLMSKNEFERKAQIEYLNMIISSCNQLLELTKNMPEDTP